MAVALVQRAAEDAAALMWAEERQEAAACAWAAKDAAALVWAEERTTAAREEDCGAEIQQPGGVGCSQSK